MVRKFEWNCRGGLDCFVKKRILKLDVFADCLPGNMSFGDMDGYVEIGGRLCVLEWKDTDSLTPIPEAQEIAFCKLTKDTGNVAFVVWGHAKTMQATCYKRYKDGEAGGVIIGGLDQLKEHIKKWVEYAYTHPRVRRKDVTV